MPRPAGPREQPEAIIQRTLPTDRLDWSDCRHSNFGYLVFESEGQRELVGVAGDDGSGQTQKSVEREHGLLHQGVFKLG